MPGDEPRLVRRKVELANDYGRYGYRRVTALLRARPASAKGQYIASVTVSSTMGPGMRLEVKEMVASAR